MIIPHIKHDINRSMYLFDQLVNREEKCMFLVVIKFAMKDKKEPINRIHHGIDTSLNSGNSE
jgi:hypothetical protein